MFFLQLGLVFTKKTDQSNIPEWLQAEKWPRLQREARKCLLRPCRSDGLAGQKALSTSTLGTSLGISRTRGHPCKQGDSLPLLSGDAPASQGDDLPQFWEAPTSGASPERALSDEKLFQPTKASLGSRSWKSTYWGGRRHHQTSILSTTASRQRSRPVSSARSRPLSITCDGSLSRPSMNPQRQPQVVSLGST